MSKVQLITQGLGNHLIEKLEASSTICILTSFVMKSGVEFLKDALKKAAENGADIKICTGDYLFVTQPDALEELLSIDDRISIRVWKSNGVSFHPKAYMLQSKNQECLFVGSSNLSKSALLNGVEWNLQISDEKEVFNEAQTQFLKLFYAEQTVPLNIETLKEYRSNYDRYHQKHPNLAQKWSEIEELNLMLPSEKDEDTEPSSLIAEPPVSYGKIQPRFAQIEALEELQKTLEEGRSKALVVMATGLGKTYLAGFFAQNFERILFIAHREEILLQAKNSFENIMPDKHFGLYNGKEKNSNADIVFASIYTLSMKIHLEKFHPAEFDLIIVDEFHHAAADSYKRAIDYFKPKFLLGITATPDRNDNKDVSAICDGNKAYSLEFLDAIQRKWLAPFKYYGVYDDTDYSQITWLGTRYDEEELLNAQLRDDLAEKILQAWKNKKQTRTLGFCSSIKQANFLSNYFNKNGFQTVSLHSQQLAVNRKKVISQLSIGEIDVIFTVDLFNEGVDIPSVDTLLFVRPTESLTVFTQQIGRGLRIYPEKEACVIIDLIGNYRNADIKLSLFNTKVEKGKVKNIKAPVPDFCEIELELEVINLLDEMSRKRQPRKEKLFNDYIKLKKDLGRRPTYLELHLSVDYDSKQFNNEFNSFFGLLNWGNELTEQEKEIFFRYKRWLSDIEKTRMKKSYKMIVLLAMLEKGPADWFKPITPREVAPFFHRFLMEKEFRKRLDFSDEDSKRLWIFDEKKISDLISTMPMSMWSGSSDGLISFENNILKLNFDVVSEDQHILFDWTKEICEYRLHYHFERKAGNTIKH